MQQEPDLFSSNSFVISSPGDEAVMYEGLDWATSSRQFEENGETLEKVVQLADEGVVEFADPVPRDIVKRTNIYAERLLACLVFAVQPELKGVDVSKKIRVVPSQRMMREGFVDVFVPIRAILSSDDDANYTYAVEAAAVLQSFVFRFVDSDGKGHKVRNLIMATDINTRDCRGSIHFTVSPEVWKLLLDFSKGYCRSEYWVARKLRRAVSYRFYKMLCCNRKIPLNHKIDDLVKSFDLPDYVRSPHIFENRVLKPVKEELDRVSPVSFEYTFGESEAARAARHRGKRRYDYVTIKPVHIVANELKYKRIVETIANPDKSVIIAKTVRDYLVMKFGFTDDELESNAGTFLAGQNKLGRTGFFEYLQDITPIVLKYARNRKAFLIDQVKKCCSE